MGRFVVKSLLALTLFLTINLQYGLADFRGCLYNQYSCGPSLVYLGSCSENEHIYCCGSGSNASEYCCPENADKRFSNKCDCRQSMCPIILSTAVKVVLIVVGGCIGLGVLGVLWYTRRSWCIDLIRWRNEWCDYPCCSEYCGCCSTSKDSEADFPPMSPPFTEDKYIYAISDRPGEKLFRRVESRSHDSGLQHVENNTARDEPVLSLYAISLNHPPSNGNKPSLNPNDSNSNNEPPLYTSSAIDSGSPCSRPQIPHRNIAHDGRSRSRQRNGIHGNRYRKCIFENNGYSSHRYIADNHSYKSRLNEQGYLGVLENISSFTPSDISRSSTTGRTRNSSYVEPLPQSPPPGYSEQLNNFVQQRLYNSPPPAYHSDI